MVAVDYGLQSVAGQWTLYGLTKDVPDAACLAVDECSAFSTEGKLLAIQVRVEYSGGAYLSRSTNVERVSGLKKTTRSWLATV